MSSIRFNSHRLDFVCHFAAFLLLAELNSSSLIMVSSIAGISVPDQEQWGVLTLREMQNAGKGTRGWRWRNRQGEGVCVERESECGEGE